MEYSITVQELIKRPIIRNNFDEEWMNKMTDDELSTFDKESYELCLKEGVVERWPDINAALLSKYIDMGILYNLFKLSNPNDYIEIEVPPYEDLDDNGNYIGNDPNFVKG